LEPPPTEVREVRLSVSPPLADEALNALFIAAWPAAEPAAFGPILAHSLCWVAAHVDEQLVGFANVAWDGGVHAFLLDPTVHPDYQRRGIGVAMVREATREAQRRGLHWMSVDYEPQLGPFYRRCGFRPSSAGVIRLAPLEPASLEPPVATPEASRSVFEIRRFESRFHEPCRALMDGLSEWFQIPEAKAAYVADLLRYPSWVILGSTGTDRDQVLGFVSLAKPQPSAFEVHVMTVRRDRHRQGIGRALLEFVEQQAARHGGRYMQVKTLAASHPDPFYARTRNFYTGVGYVPLFETDQLWGADNPTLILVKALR